MTQASSIVVGVLALQGDFKEHLASLEEHDVSGLEVRTRSDLKAVDALILPGGESTTIAKLLLSTGLDSAIQERIESGMPVWGTCAGAILLAKDVTTQISLDTTIGAMNIDIVRNAYGRQADSFVTSLDLPSGKQQAFFIRAPQVTRIGRGVTTLLSHKGNPVLLRQKHLLLSTFHSELHQPDRVLEFFLEMCTKVL